MVCSELSDTRLSNFQIRTRFIELMISNGVFSNGTFAPTYATRNKVDEILVARDEFDTT